MRYKTGDTVIIRPDLADGSFDVGINEPMESLAGRTTRVRQIEWGGKSCRYRLEIDIGQGYTGAGWIWTEDMLLPFCSDEDSTVEESDKPISYLLE